MKYTEKHWTGYKRTKTFNFLLESALLITNSQNMKKSPIGDQHWDHNDGSWEEVYGQARNLYCDPRSIRDPELVNFYQTYTQNLFDTSNDANMQKKLDQATKKWYKDWYHLNNFVCLPQTSTQQTIIDFCLQNKHRNIVMHQQGYWQTQWFNKIKVNSFKTKDLVNSIEENSAVILDLPLRGTMQIPGWIEKLFTKCDNLGVPVLIDTAYLMLQNNPSIDFDRKCISHICCTLSKTYSFLGQSLGFKFQKSNSISKYDLYYGQNRFNIKIILDLLSSFPCRYLFNKYKPLQEKWSQILDLEPSTSVKHLNITDNTDNLQWFNSSKFWHDNGLSQNLIDLTVLFENDNLLTTYWNL